MPERCVVGHCSNVRDPEKGISLHKIPFFEDDRPVAKRRRRQWVAFVQRRRARWNATKSSVICSSHFKPEDFERRLTNLPGFGCMKPYLKEDEIGVVPVPSIYPAVQEQEGGDCPTSSRQRRKSIKDVQESLQSAQAAQETETSVIEEAVTVVAAEDNPDLDHSLQCHEEMFQDAVCQTSLNCVSCNTLKEQNRRLQNQLTSNRRKLRSLQWRVRKRQQKETKTAAQNVLNKDGPEEIETDVDEIVEEVLDLDQSFEEDVDMDASFVEDEDMYDSDSEDEPECIYSAETDARKEPKFIVFLSQLLLLLQFCPVCKEDSPLLETKKIGTMAEIRILCANPKCHKRENTWRSQPQMEGTRIPAGNILLSFAILLAGGTATKVLRMFSHMGLACISLKTFFKHQREKLFPAITLYWKQYQTKMLDSLKKSDEKLVICGDGRHDSMGHCAKYGAYSVMCTNKQQLIHFELVQRNEVGSSPLMEYEGFLRSFSFLKLHEFNIDVFVSDRHLTIAKHMREKENGIKHYFDLWHLKKKIRKLLTKIAALKDCEEVSVWIQPCVNHLHWSAVTTPSGDGNLIWAKFKSFLSHVVNKHSNLDEPLFNKCAHAEIIQNRKWLRKESVAYQKVVAALTDPRLVKGIKQASPITQTSCVEGFHSLLNHFAPKMIAYSHTGMQCRHILATTHFNYNLHREAKKFPDGSVHVTVRYPKFKNGEAVVKSVRVAANFVYVDEIYTILETAVIDGSLKEISTLIQAKVPAPMNTMLTKQSRGEAIAKYKERQAMVITEVPATGEAQNVAEQQSQQLRKKPSCLLCKQPMKGHKNVLNCPKTMK